MKFSNPIKFIVSTSRGSEPNSCYLIKTSWDDFSFRTTLDVYYFDDISKKTYFGVIKIMIKGQVGNRELTTMPDSEFLSLSDDYCSLGGQSYYEELMELDSDIRDNILTSLRDCVFDNDIYQLNKYEEAMTNSLLRSVDTIDRTRLFPSILAGNIQLTPYHFQYWLNGEEKTNIDVEVKPYSNPPSNLHILIGRNGVGKTRILSGITDELTKNNNENPISQRGELKFTEYSEEMFSNIITVVFSAFDHFKPVRNNQAKESIPCQYVGLKNHDGDSFKSPDDLKGDFMDSVKICLQGARKQRWLEAIDILNSDIIFKEYNLYEIVNGDNVNFNIEKIFNDLSSGHKIILLTITKLVELVNEKTLVLIDEPENHLHPPLLSSFIRAISDLLIKRNAVALIATHSPVVLQEAPKTCVTKINRVGAEYCLHRPKNETYGENIDTLTRDVFRLELEDSGFYKIISNFLKKDGATYEGLMKEFNNQIGSEGRAIARAIIHNKKSDDA